SCRGASSLVSTDPRAEKEWVSPDWAVLARILFLFQPANADSLCEPSPSAIAIAVEAPASYRGSSGRTRSMPSGGGPSARRPAAGDCGGRGWIGGEGIPTRLRNQGPVGTGSS